MPPDVTIVIPCYNASHTVMRCMKSAVTQTTSEKIEIIAIDDCSTDDTYDILSRLSKENPSISIIANNCNSGVSKSRNKGIEAASGKYVTFLDADDEIAPDFCEHLVNLAMKYDDDIVACNFLRVGGDGNSRRLFCASNPPVAISGSEYSHDLIHAQFFDNCTGKLFKRTFLQTNNLRFNPMLSFGEDTLFSNLSAIRAKHITIDSEYSGYLYYSNPLSCMSTIDVSRRIENLRILLESLKKSVKPDEERLMLRKSLEYVWTIKKYGGKDRILLLEKMVKDSLWDEIVLPIILKYGKLKHRIAARLLNNGFHTAIKIW